MTGQERKTQALVDTAIVCGLIAGVLYPASSLGLLPGRYGDMAFMLFGPFFAVAVFGMRSFFARANDTASNDIGHLMLVIAGVAFALMATMQMSIWSLAPAHARGATALDAPTWRAILNSISTTQLGLDFAFDMFVSGGASLLGWQVMRHPGIAAWIRLPVGLAGVAIGLGGLTLNIIAFPNNAGDVGLIDPAQFFGVWFGFVWLPMLVLRRWRADQSSGA